ncbi:PACE efflux transporter [Acetobacter sp. LMG 1627]|uniref:PACE efflux transporter n=2 Tax=Acetobacter conturbans TaxID=1737472 RepID=A0ABX0JXH8_9PROT|nr:PACE efflux transporter [Acetobacter conturbans]
MRSGPDRIRHALLFECMALALVIPTGSLLFGIKASDMGVIGVFSAVTATIWNYLFNGLFDRTMIRLKGSTRKTLTLRVVHTLLFEAGLQVVLLPAIAAYLGVSIMEALSLNTAIAVFYLFYAFFFNMGYDAAFPLHASRMAGNREMAVSAE